MPKPMPLKLERELKKSSEGFWQKVQSSVVKVWQRIVLFVCKIFRGG
jgi:hypothetical protein